MHRFISRLLISGLGLALLAFCGDQGADSKIIEGGSASNGASLQLIGQLLDHTQPQTTQRYAHLAAKRVREVNDAVGEHLPKLLRTSEYSRTTDANPWRSDRIDTFRC